MSTRTNINAQVRGVFFAESGDDAWSGQSAELPKATIPAAITAVMALDPPPSLASTAQVTASQGGLFSNSFVLPDFVQLLAEGVSLTVSDPNAITLGSALLCQITTVINNQNSGSCFNIDGKFSVGIDARFGSANGGSSSVVVLTGACDDIFITVSQIALVGDSSAGFLVDASSPTPIDININTVTMDGDNTCLLDWNTPSLNDIGSIDVSTITEAGSGGEIFTVRSGRLEVDAIVLSATSITTVKSGAQFSLDAQVVVGNTLVESGGFAIYDSIGLILGDIEVEAGATLEIICHRHTGSLTIDGTLNGLINGIPYGTYREKIEDKDTAETQRNKILQPTGLGGVEWVAPLGTMGDAFITENNTSTNYSEDVWRDIRSGDAFSLGGCNSGFILDDSDSGALELTDASFSGFYFVTSSFDPTSSKTYEFRITKDTGSGYATLPENIVYSVNEGNSAPTTVVINAPISMLMGDKVRIESRNTDGDDDATWRTVTICMMPKADNYKRSS